MPRSAGKTNIYLGHPDDTKTEIKKIKKKGFPVVPKKEIATIILRQFMNLAEYKVFFVFSSFVGMTIRVFGRPVFHWRFGKEFSFDMLIWAFYRK